MITVTNRLMPQHQWVFRAVPERIIDGDTIDVSCDLGLRSCRCERLRLLGVNAPERRTTTLEAGNAARDFVADWLFEATAVSTEWPLLLQTVKADSFGRYLATVWRVSDGRCLNEDLLLAGHAVPDIRP